MREYVGDDVRLAREKISTKRTASRLKTERSADGVVEGSGFE